MTVNYLIISGHSASHGKSVTLIKRRPVFIESIVKSHARVQIQQYGFRNEFNTTFLDPCFPNK